MRRTEKLFTSPKRESSVELVINTIKQLLLNQQLLPGDRLPSETELGNSLSVSRGPIREAMKILSAFGIVEIRRGDGTYIATSQSSSLFEPLLFSLILSRPDKKNLQELRVLIELGIIRLAVENADEDDIQRIQDEINAMEGKVLEGEKDLHILTQYDLNFHLALARATKNELLERIYASILDYLAPSIGEAHEHDPSGMVALNVHKKILKALKERNAEHGNAAVEESINAWADWLQKA